MTSPDEIRDVLRRLRRRGGRRWGSGRAAVAVTVVTGADGPAVLLIRRAAASGAQPGQLELPGGCADRLKSVSSVVRRHLAAGAGIRLPPESVLGLLDDYTIPTGLVITPVVLWAGEHVESRPAAPAAEVITVPFTELDVEPVFLVNSESDRPVIRLPLHGGWLPAPTAAVLHQFREVILQAPPLTRIQRAERG